jgi:16S rRNA (cytosine967-C5)-methyltransferase
MTRKKSAGGAWRAGPGAGVRATAARLVARALESRAPVDVPLARAGQDRDERDRRLLAELVYGALRWKSRLDDVVAAASRRSIDAIDAALLPALEVAAYQLLFLDRVPAHAAVKEAVDDVRAIAGRGATGFANAVLRRIAAAPALESWPVEEADPIRKLAIEHSHPETMVARWIARFGRAATERVLRADNGPRSLHLLSFRDRGGREELARRLAAEGVAATAGTLSPLALSVGSGDPLAGASFARGDFYVQDEASQAAALVPSPRSGERVLDAAAAPGGKAFALLAFEPSVRVVLADSGPRRLARVTANLRRLGRAAPVVAADAGTPPWRAGGFDRVLLDAPCTGTGTLRRHPELRWRFGIPELERLAADSALRLRALAPGVAPGGRLILLTCSIEAEENEGLASDFLAREPSFEADPLEDLDPGLRAGRTAAGFWQVLPGDGHDGFSVSVFRRRG